MVFSYKIGGLLPGPQEEVSQTRVAAAAAAGGTGLTEVAYLGSLFALLLA